MTVRSWQPDQRQLSIGRGAASYLEVHENYNPGWAATLNGQQLTPVRLDGWQQAFVVPAGAGGTITLSFRPAATYHLVLVASLLAVALLLAIAAWSFTAASQRAAASPGPTATQDEEAGGASRAARRRAAYRAAAGLAHVLAVAALILWRAARWRSPSPCSPGWPGGRRGRRAGRPRARGCRGCLRRHGRVGLLSAVRPFGEGLFGPFGWPAQACALVALAAALIPAAARPPAAVAGEEDR